MKVFRLFAFAAVALIGVTACQDGLTDSSTISGDKVSMTFRIQSEDSDLTKAYIGNDGFPTFVDGDKIGLYTPNSKYLVIGASGSSNVKVDENGNPTFTAEFGLATQEDAKLYAYYPYNSNLGFFAKIIYNEQFTGYENLRNPIPMVSEPVNLVEAMDAGSSQKVDLKFKNLGTVVRFHVKAGDPIAESETVESIIISSDNTMAGIAVVDVLPSFVSGNINPHMQFISPELEKYVPMDLVRQMNLLTTNYITIWNNPGSGISASSEHFWGSFIKDPEQSYDAVTVPGIYKNATVTVITDISTYQYKIPEIKSIWERNVVNNYTLVLSEEKRLGNRYETVNWMAADTLFAVTEVEFANSLDGNTEKTICGKVVLPRARPEAKNYDFAGWVADSKAESVLPGIEPDFVANDDPFFVYDGLNYTTMVTDDNYDSYLKYLSSIQGAIVNHAKWTDTYRAVFTYTGKKGCMFEVEDCIGGSIYDGETEGKVTFISYDNILSDNGVGIGELSWTGGEYVDGDLIVKSLTFTPREGIEVSSIALTQKTFAEIEWLVEGTSYNTSTSLLQGGDSDEFCKAGSYSFVNLSDDKDFKPGLITIHFYDKKSYEVL